MSVYAWPKSLRLFFSNSSLVTEKIAPSSPQSSSSGMAAMPRSESVSDAFATLEKLM